MSSTAWAVKPNATIINPWRGSRTIVIAASSRNPTANAMSKPTPGSFSRTTANPIYAPAVSDSSSAAIWASRSCSIRRCGDSEGVIVARTDCHVSATASAPKATRTVRSASLTKRSAFEEVERIDVVVRGIDGRDDGLEVRRGAARLRFPQVALEGQVQARAVGRKQDAHARTMRIRRVHVQDHRDLSRTQLDEIARRVDAEQLHETANQVLIELRPFVFLEDGDDPVCRVRLLIRALRAHRVVDVGDGAQHRTQVH